MSKKISAETMQYLIKSASEVAAFLESIPLGLHLTHSGDCGISYTALGRSVAQAKHLRDELLRASVEAAHVE